jgi:hypothetical protein
MSTFSWVLAAVGLFLVLYAAASMLRRPRGERRRRRESLGCFFVPIAGVVWSIALSRFVDDHWAGWRLGFALAFLLPAVAALLSPGRGRVILSVVVLTFSVLLGASAVPVLWQKVHPSRSSVMVGELDGAILDLEDRIEQATGYVEDLKDDADGLKARVGQLGYGSFDDLAANPDALSLLEEWSEVDAMLVRTEKWLADAGRTLDRTKAARRRMRRLEEGEAATGVPVTQEEVSSILGEVRAEGSPPGPATVEEYAAREHLRELFETEFGQ